MSEDVIRNAVDEIDALLAQRLNHISYLTESPARQEIAAILSRWFDKGETVRTEVERRIKSLRGVVIESGNKRDAAFVEGGIAALENLLNDLPAAPAAPSPGEPPAGLRNATTLCRSGEGKPKVELWFKELADAQAVHKWLTTTIAAALRTSVEGESE